MRSGLEALPRGESWWCRGNLEPNTARDSPAPLLAARQFTSTCKNNKLTGKRLMNYPFKNQILLVSFLMIISYSTLVHGFSWCSLLLGVNPYSCEKLPFKSIGIPFSIQINTNASGFLGAGLQIFGNVNTKQSVAGFGFIFKFGKQGQKLA
jgi:hypothetical protein